MGNKIRIAVAAVTGVLIIVFGIIFRQPVIKMLPFLISLFVMMLQGKANRYGFLAGALNSIIYIYVYWILGVYSTMAYVLLFSCPIQLFTFFNWQKHSYEKSVAFKKMSKKLRIFTAVAYVLAWVGVYIVLKMLKSEVAVLDTTSSLIGVLVFAAYRLCLYRVFLSLGCRHGCGTVSEYTACVCRYRKYHSRNFRGLQSVLLHNGIYHG